MSHIDQRSRRRGTASRTTHGTRHGPGTWPPHAATIAVKGAGLGVAAVGGAFVATLGWNLTTLRHGGFAFAEPGAHGAAAADDGAGLPELPRHDA